MAIRNFQDRVISKYPDLESKDIELLCKMIEERAGIHMKASKHDLMRTRLRHRLEVNGLQDLSEYRKYLNALPLHDPEWEEFTNLLTTNKTDFFREPKHFDFLTDTILPVWLKTGQSTFKVWSAASSTGEEAFTVAMILTRHLPKNRNFKILATDIDTEVLKTAQNSVYPSSRKLEIPAEYHQSCLQFGRRDAEGWFRVRPHLKNNIFFKQHNLIEKSSPGEGTFDLVLCRNVLINFSASSIDFVQKKLFSATKKNGHLFIGHSESFHGLQHAWTPAGPSIFRKN